MKRNCPQNQCKSSQIIKNGFYKRANDSRRIQRFKCKVCCKQFSLATGTLEFGQKKRRVNFLLFKLFSAKVSIRRAAKIVGVNKITATRKFDYWSKKAKLENQKFRKQLIKNKVIHMQFDDLITKEKSKLKPLSVTIAVDAERRFILGSKVSQIAAFGLLAEISKKKYGIRKSEHKDNLDTFFYELRDIISPIAKIDSDEHVNYLLAVKKHFKHACYTQYKSERGCIAGQGELKKVKRDPLFAINHTMAVLRDGMGRLVRRSWCVTQDPRRLQGHLDIFIYYYNRFYLGGMRPYLPSG